MNEEVKLLACSLVHHVFAFEAEDFADQLHDGHIIPYEGVGEQEWSRRRDLYIEKDDESDFDWLALNSQGHVYCDATRLNTYLGCCDD